MVVTGPTGNATIALNHDDGRYVFVYVPRQIGVPLTAVVTIGGANGDPYALAPAGTDFFIQNISTGGYVYVYGRPQGSANPTTLVTLTASQSALVVSVGNGWRVLATGLGPFF